MKILGKPYAGKLHVRFDEGKEEVRSENVAVTLYRLLLLFYSTENCFMAFVVNELIATLVRNLN
jgi:hypothetical protein